MWYRKHFHIQEMGDRKYFIEWGVQQGILPRATYQKAMDKAWKALAASVHESPAPTRDGIRCQPYREHHSEESEYHSSRKEQRIEDHRRCRWVEITHTFYRK